jgi:hypothetical protein
VARAIDIDKDRLFVRDHLFFQADWESVSWILKGDEFTSYSRGQRRILPG